MVRKLNELSKTRGIQSTLNARIGTVLTKDTASYVKLF